MPMPVVVKRRSRFAGILDPGYQIDEFCPFTKGSA